MFLLTVLLIFVKEVEICLFPVSLDIPYPPGQFSAVIVDEPHVIGSFPKNVDELTQDVANTFIAMSWWTKLTVLSLTLVIEILTFLQGKQKIDQRCETVEGWTLIFWKAIERTPSTLFSQYLPGRSLKKLFYVLGLQLFTFYLSATFSTDTIIGNDEKLPKTLRDVIDLDLTPHFFEGESMIESFQSGSTAEYRDIYALAESKSTQTPFSLGGTDAISYATPGNVMISSLRIARTGTMLRSLFGNHQSQSVYISRPYYRSLQAFLYNPMNKSEQFKKLFNSM